MDLGWFGVASIIIHSIQGGISVAHHFRLRSKCCGVDSGIQWDVDPNTTPVDKATKTGEEKSTATVE